MCYKYIVLFTGDISLNLIDTAITAEEFTQKQNSSSSTVHHLQKFRKLSKHRKWVPHDLTEVNCRSSDFMHFCGRISNLPDEEICLFHKTGLVDCNKITLNLQ